MGREPLKERFKVITSPTEGKSVRGRKRAESLLICGLDFDQYKI